MRIFGPRERVGKRYGRLVIDDILRITLYTFRIEMLYLGAVGSAHTPHTPYVMTTGTGSGKSLTYLIPVVDHVLRHAPEAGGVRAIIVDPMNAPPGPPESSLSHVLQSH
ncbi:MAG: DEAD/DEAH box helicase [Oscillochloris sp.]|nr:DEAD/DEAH box helicase [Oscillochloris sp.]